MKLLLPFKINQEIIEDLEVTWVFSKQFVTHSLLINVDAGSFYESNPSLDHSLEGSFHFLEHMVFKPTHKIDYIKKFHQTGTTYNAFTTQFNTLFYTHFIDPDPAILLNLTRMVFEKRLFIRKAVDMEREIIFNEILTLQDDPLVKVYETWHKFLFQHCPVWKNTLGNRIELKHITHKHLNFLHERYYHPKQARLLIVTNRDRKFWMPALNKLFSQNINRQNTRIELVLPMELNRAKRAYIKEKTYPHSVPFLVAGCKPIGQHFTLQDKIMMDILTQTVFNGFSKMQDDLLFKGFVDDSYEVDIQCEKEYGYWSLSGYSDYPVKMAEMILKEMRRRNQSGLTKDEFLIMKQHFLSNCLMQAYDSMEMPFILNHLIHFGLKTWEEYYHLIESITWEKMNERLPRFMAESQFRVLIMRPE